MRKRRMPGACDVCKRKKSDSAEKKGSPCSNCELSNIECTHNEVTKTLGSAKEYVKNLETRTEKMEKLLTKLLPGVDISAEIDQLTVAHVTDVVDDGSSPTSTSDAETLPRNDDDEASHLDYITKLGRLRLNPPHNRFFGKSSGYQLVQTALDMKNEYTGNKILRKPVLSSKRSEFWNMPPWRKPEVETELDVQVFQYPDNDLLLSLVNLYFQEINVYLPLFHRPTFERDLSDELHMRDRMFGSIVLLVCALGSRYSNDPRVLIDDSNSTRSAGYKWFKQVNLARKSLIARASLHELQMLALAVLYCQATETPQGVWILLGMALRMAQEVGAHRRRSQKDGQTTVENELWKRVFWVLVSMDRLISSFAGRPCGLHEEDYDQDYPIECDDEYWECTNPAECFQQPSDTPSTMSFFTCYLGLMDILAYAMRVVYPTRRSKNAIRQAGFRSEQQIIAELDSEMNRWMDSVPSHLRWNPNRENKLFLKQSAALYAIYYHLQIFIHRPFIPSPRNPSVSTPFPSLAICTNAARSCCHVLEVFCRLSILPLPQLHATVFTAAVVLLLNIWSGQKSGFAPNPRREMEDVQKCMDMLAACEQRWCTAGRYWDILVELASVKEADVSNQDLQAKQIEDPYPSRLDTNESRPEAGYRSSSRSRDEQHYKQDPGLPAPTASHNSPGTEAITQKESLLPPPVNYALPMYSNELGQLPIYGQFGFSDNSQMNVDYNLSEAQTTMKVVGPGNRPRNDVNPGAYDQVRHQERLASPRPPSQTYGLEAQGLQQLKAVDVQSSVFPRYSASSNVPSASKYANRGGENPQLVYHLDQPVGSWSMNLGFGWDYHTQEAEALQMMDSDTMAMWLAAGSNFE
ncbi:hypothetical protein AMATHDRAFT_73129 [Amanita thiersii Skay4041]|uniref:Transcription factor domain-containing protein n=1 Tax=Amanita thiersii Skay4041 TaxID=703135 RepID=A0A2A9NT19_9AGAR|nr:hypothetical protein AMATHDRAFT_73129 [Amanita thiersii Skay4041]